MHPVAGVDTVILLDEVGWRYTGADTPVLNGLTLHIARGETVLLCGASGSGKSSVLRLMNGLIPHFHEGELDGGVYLDGRTVAELPLDQIGRLTGTVLQHPRRQFFNASVDSELAFASENFGEPPERIRHRVSEVTDQYGLAPFTMTQLRDLSGGQQQRVACAAAVTHRPELLLFDEPTSNLAPAAIADFATALSRLRASGATLVIAEHRLHFLPGLVDRVVVLRDGSVETEWSGEEFSRIDENTLTAKGLRSLTAPQTRCLPTTWARGRSVAAELTRVVAAGDDGMTLRGVGCSFRGRRVLDIDEAHFPAGKVTAITGPNGAGKSTLARIVVGLQRHDGQIFLDGRRISRGDRLRMSAIVMQDVQRQLFTDSVQAELRLGVPSQARAQVRNQLEEFGLDQFSDRHPLSLSGGQQQRLVVAVAKLSGRRIVVFDEPSSGVDRKHLRAIAGVVRALAEDGAVVLLISHDGELLALAADQELRLRARLAG